MGTPTLSFLFSFSLLSSFSSLFISLHLHLCLFSSPSLSVSLCLPSLLSLSLFIALASGGSKKERTLCVQLSVGLPNLAIHNACHVSLFPSALFEPAETTTVSDRHSSPNFRSWSMKTSFQQSRPRVLSYCSSSGACLKHYNFLIYWDVYVVWCSSVEGTRGVCVCVCLFVCCGCVRCSLVHCRLSLVAFVVVWMVGCGGVVSVTLGASTRVSPDVARLKLS